MRHTVLLFVLAVWEVLAAPDQLAARRGPEASLTSESSGGASSTSAEPAAQVLAPEASSTKNEADSAEALAALADASDVLAQQGQLAAAAAQLQAGLQQLRAKGDLPAGEEIKALLLLGRLARQQLDFPTAGSALREASRLADLHLDRRSLEYANVLNGLGVFFLDQGDLARAEPVLTEALSIQNAHPETNPVDVGLSCANLGGLHYSLGDFSRAVLLHTQSLEIFQEAVGERHPYYAIALNNVAGAQHAMRDLAAAEKSFRRSMELHRDLHGDQHPTYWLAVGNLGTALLELNRLEEARELLRRNWEWQREQSGADSPQTLAPTRQLAAVERRLGNLQAAEGLLQAALVLSERRLGPESPETHECRIDLAMVRHAREDFVGALPLSRRIAEWSLKRAEYLGPILSARQQLALTESLIGSFHHYLSLCRHVPTEQRAAYDLVLSWKGGALRRQLAVRQAAQTPELRELLAELQEVSRKWAALAQAPAEGQNVEFQARLTELAARKEAIERALGRRSAPYRRTAGTVSSQEIVRLLPPRTALVDFYEFIEIEPPQQHDGQRPAPWRTIAYIVKSDGVIACRDLGPSAEIQASAEQWRVASGRGERGEAAARRLRRLVWEPYADLLEGVETVLTCPDGPLEQIPLAGLPGALPSSYLLESYRFAVLPTAHLLADWAAPWNPAEVEHDLLVVGDVDYDAAPSARTAQTVAGGLSPGSQTPGRWSRLPGLRKEPATIAALYRQARPERAAQIVTLRGADATEARFRALAPHCRWMHLATHAYSSLTPPPPAPPDDPAAADQRVVALDRQAEVRWHGHGLLAGFALAGANWSAAAGSDAPLADDDGLVTAEELACLPLNNLELAVLSACDTALGESYGSEGPLGLQRALHVSGARYVIASLWEVDDRATAGLMERFYQGMVREGLTPPDALRSAQLWAMEHPAELWSAVEDEALPAAVRGMVASARSARVPGQNAGRTPPEFWAGFVISGSPQQ